MATLVSLMAWTQKLTRPLVLRDGRQLVTLSDVRAVFIDRFSTVTRSEPIAYSGKLLLDAARTGRRADIDNDASLIHDDYPRPA